MNKIIEFVVEVTNAVKWNWVYIVNSDTKRNAIKKVKELYWVCSTQSLEWTSYYVVNSDKYRETNPNFKMIKEYINY